MIFEIFGLPGSGKTTTLTAIAQHSLKHKNFLGIPWHNKVFTTFYCQGCYKLNFDDLKEYDFSDSLIIIDEISLYADNRNFKVFSSEYVHFFKMHRHDSIDLVWASQDMDDADKKIRNVTDTIYLAYPASFGRTCLKKVLHDFSFNHGNYTHKYIVAPRIAWKYIKRKKYYKYFDSYETYKKDRKQPELIRWEDVK